MPSMVSYSKAAMERAMKVQEVILRAIAKKITWWQNIKNNEPDVRHKTRSQAEIEIRSHSNRAP